MRIAACLLLFSGFLLACAALVLLGSLAQRFVFTAAAIAVEALGLALLFQAHKSMQKVER